MFCCGRLAARHITSHEYFDPIITTLILMSTVTMAIQVLLFAREQSWQVEARNLRASKL